MIDRAATSTEGAEFVCCLQSAIYRVDSTLLACARREIYADGYGPTLGFYFVTAINRKVQAEGVNSV